MMLWQAVSSIATWISKNIPTTKDVEPLLEIDGDIRSFEVFLSSRTPVLTVHDVEMFLPCTVNLDPKLREIIAGAVHSHPTYREQ
ncbi:kinase D-interacting substrate of 220 kDa isoform X1 [Tachysurus ichikawai]